ncbi:unnamed protein product [Ambrosiozyma monospora]|uniref:Unnamed protein product n=1 Tax=Ambrosiozyma monospora TaxID=43982 RepID=A0ACB5SZ82_AMBMO|nr:unnamed protein product [Ambrosiozyma monospora]
MWWKFEKVLPQIPQSRMHVLYTMEVKQWHLGPRIVKTTSPIPYLYHPPMPPLFSSLINPRTTRLFHTTTLRMTYQLIALGNPLLDIQFNVDKAYLDKYGLKENDAILVEEKHMPIFGEGLANPNVKLVAGGAAQNSARGAQYVLPPKSVLYFGAVGKDVYADKLTEANNKYGLDTAYQVLDDVPTGKCAALINGNNRSLATDLSACNHFKPAHLQKPENWAHIEKADFCRQLLCSIHS